jgi:hypothetical protein
MKNSFETPLDHMILLVDNDETWLNQALLIVKTVAEEHRRLMFQGTILNQLAYDLRKFFKEIDDSHFKQQRHLWYQRADADYVSHWKPVAQYYIDKYDEIGTVNPNCLPQEWQTPAQIRRTEINESYTHSN